ncbi:hypothetical protein J2X36_000736 [Methylobacterium sp. BE186]|uniref:hypothetical protein n=1 Tax=Methylobacterium sp. BE186 TaxID=2817715 RepID=UPI00286052E5|nr:hypothetical protein [Methylobacterium sp. BE186]MDR7036000.1 hypothetical protein [Methylobacterium sp. BE186]
MEIDVAQAEVRFAEARLALLRPENAYKQNDGGDGNLLAEIGDRIARLIAARAELDRGVVE